MEDSRPLENGVSWLWNGILQSVCPVDVKKIHRQLGNVVEECVRVLQSSMRPSVPCFTTLPVTMRKRHATDGRKAIGGRLDCVLMESIRRVYIRNRHDGRSRQKIYMLPRQIG